LGPQRTLEIIAGHFFEAGCPANGLGTVNCKIAEFDVVVVVTS